jgi:hypothetical protein
MEKKEKKKKNQGTNQSSAFVYKQKNGRLVTFENSNVTNLVTFEFSKRY